MSEMSDENRRAEFLQAVRQGVTLEDASAILGVTSRTVRRWREADSELDELVLDAMSGADDCVEAATYKQCLDPNPANNAVRIFWLKSRRSDVYGDRRALELSGPKGGPIPIDLNALTNDQLGQLLSLLDQVAPESGGAEATGSS